MDGQTILVVLAIAAFCFFMIKRGFDSVMKEDSAERRLVSQYRLREYCTAGGQILGLNFDEQRVVLGGLESAVPPASQVDAGGLPHRRSKGRALRGYCGQKKQHPGAEADRENPRAAMAVEHGSTCVLPAWLQLERPRSTSRVHLSTRLSFRSTSELG